MDNASDLLSSTLTRSESLDNPAELLASHQDEWSAFEKSLQKLGFFENRETSKDATVARQQAIRAFVAHLKENESEDRDPASVVYLFLQNYREDVVSDDTVDQNPNLPDDSDAWMEVSEKDLEQLLNERAGISQPAVDPQDIEMVEELVGKVDGFGPSLSAIGGGFQKSDGDVVFFFLPHAIGDVAQALQPTCGNFRVCNLVKLVITMLGDCI